MEEIATPEPVEEAPKTAEVPLEQTISQPIEEPKPHPEKKKGSKLTFGQTILEKVKKFFEEVE